MISGRAVMGQEKEQRYVGLLSAAGELYETDLDQAAALLDQARDLFPERVDADRQETYALYLNGQWQACVDHGTAALAAYGPGPPDAADRRLGAV